MNYGMYQDISRARQNAQIYDAAKAATTAATSQGLIGGTTTSSGGTIVAGGTSSVSPLGFPTNTTSIATPAPSMNSINTMATLTTLLPPQVAPMVGGNQPR
eukprot:Protomagalhaensia_wolfi_Nauph_80__3174@NODE_322_length_2789_cov_5_557091_g242_i0_p4_GENE_NODE_322_length_2789_cov_5_557091_g242_i0NODE_322_length_2789_cov_5_557091_g242_i0_p4_ORF_typecomplete_len101_score12_41_NODE_322_length_2789_cov_5_557091_g242_i0585887